MVRTKRVLFSGKNWDGAVTGTCLATNKLVGRGIVEAGVAAHLSGLVAEAVGLLQGLVVLPLDKSGADEALLLGVLLDAADATLRLHAVEDDVGANVEVVLGGSLVANSGLVEALVLLVNVEGTDEELLHLGLARRSVVEVGVVTHLSGLVAKTATTSYSQLSLTPPTQRFPILSAHYKKK